MAAPHLEPTVLDWALEYATYGWRVVPIGPGIKHPKVPAWQNAATSDPATIKNWWTGLYRDHGVGIATGPASRLFVLDVDVSFGKHGDDTLAELEERHGQLPATVEVQTGSGGRHLYYRYPADGRTVRNNASTRLGPGLDIRGDGGQVLAPPTVHPNGTPYVWVIGQGPLEHRIANAPDWLLELVCETESEPLPRPKTETSLPLPSDPPGARWAATITWRQLLEGDGWTFHHEDQDGETYYTRPGKDRRDGPSATVGHKGSDVLKVFTTSHPTLRPEETYSKFGYLAATRFAGDMRAAAQWCSGVVDRPATYEGAAAAESNDGPRSFLERLKAETYRGIAGLAAIPPVRYLLHPLIAVDSLFQIFAPSSAGKSFAAIDIACCVATGKKWHGHAVVQGPAVYVVAEGASGIRDRLAAWAAYHNGNEDPIDVYVITLPAMLHRLDEASALAVWCAEIGARIVIIDTYARSTLGLDENKNNEAGLAIDGLDTIRRATGAAVGIVHHTGHQGARGRGASALYAAMDTVIAIEGDSTSLLMSTDPQKGGKQKNGSDDWTVTLAKIGQPVGRTDELGLPVTSLVLASGVKIQSPGDIKEQHRTTLEALERVAVPEGVTGTVWRDQALQMGVPKTTFYNHVKELRGTGLVGTSPSGRTTRYLLLRDESQSVPVSPSPDSHPSPIVPPPFRGGTGGTDGTGTDDDLDLEPF